jgi:hypothetical protein
MPEKMPVKLQPCQTHSAHIVLAVRMVLCPWNHSSQFQICTPTASRTQHGSCWWLHSCDVHVNTIVCMLA